MATIRIKKEMEKSHMGTKSGTYVLATIHQGTLYVNLPPWRLYDSQALTMMV